MTGNVLSCVALNVATEDADDRVGLIADAKPSCECEAESFSEHSPSLVDAREKIVRMVCVPMHVHLKRQELKTSFFSHVASVGASVQRLDHATDDELHNCVKGLISGNPDRLWLGYVEASAEDIRKVMPRDGKQSLCVMDAGLPDNPAHAEIHAAFRIPEADQIEFRVALRDLFVKAGVQGRRSLRDGAVWGKLGDDLKARRVPEAWNSIA